MLTKQENKIANLIGVGLSDKETADALHIAPRTVVKHKQNIYEKLHINKATELVVWVWCNKTNTEFDLEALIKQVLSIFLLLCLIPAIFQHNNDFVRGSRARRGRRGRDELVIDDNDNLNLWMN